MSRLSDLILEAKRLDPALGEALDGEIRHLQERRSFGLNFERHAPEAVDLFGRPVRMGDNVRMLPPRGSFTAPDNRLWKVTGATGSREERVAQLVDPKTDEMADYPVADLVVVAESTDVIYPGLESTRRIELDGDKPFHTVVNAENLHALKALLYTHRASIDCIYIDPPYNTGSDDWIYSDRYVGGDDMYRHSKWLSFMERRLVLAKELLKDTGVIIVAIGDDEHHRLRMLMDQTLGAENFLSDITWQGRVKNDRRFTGGGSDYMLAYAAHRESLVDRDVRWKEPKNGVPELLSVAADAYRSAISAGQSKESAAQSATAALRQWTKTMKGQVAGGVLAYNQVDAEGRVFQPGPLDSPNPRPNLIYQVLHPVTGLAVPTPAKGWRVSEQVMESMRANGEIVWGVDHTTGIRRKLILDSESVGVPAPTFTADRDTGTARLVKLLGGTRFPNPKPVEVLQRWLQMTAPPNATVLDFFGGSGSTLEAVARLNAQDGGTRQCILVTNNEVGSKEAKRLTKEGHRQGDPEWEAMGVHDWVTKPRIVAVTTGERPDGSTFDDTVAANVEFFKLTYEAPLKVASHHDFLRIAPLLWLRAGARGRRIEELPNGWDVADAYGVIDRLECVEAFVAALEANPSAMLAYVVTDDERRFQTVCAGLPEHVEPVRLYESYLRNFQIDAARSAR